MGDLLFSAGVSFGRTLVGMVTRPYETYRRLVDRGSLWELLAIAVLVSVYVVVARIQIVPVVATFCITVGLFWIVGNVLGARGSLRGFSVGWGYTLVPTLVWFWGTSILYILLPPPRTTSGAGILFSVVYLVFSATLLFWKITLAYLALRFGLKLDLAKISVACAVVLPVLGMYSFWMYRLGIFRIPFL